MPTLVRDPLDPYHSMWNWLAFELRVLRELNGLSLAQVARLITCGRSTVSNQEAGRQHPSMDQLKILDSVYHTGSRLQLLLHHARTGHDPEWFKQYSREESVATIIRIYHPQFVPLPFQTEGYARALRDPYAPGAEERLAGALARQAALLERRAPPELWLLLEESVLDQVYGTSAIMREQLAHLVELAQAQHMSARILPRNCGYHAGANGSFRVITTPKAQLAYAGAYRGGRLIQAPADVHEAMLDFERMGQQALPTSMSIRLIESKLEAYA